MLALGPFCQSPSSGAPQRPYGYYFASGRPDERVDGMNLQVKGYSAVKSRIFRVESNGTTIYIHEHLWQADKIAIQEELYRELAATHVVGPGIDKLEARALASQGLRPGARAVRNLVVKRTFLLFSGGKQISVALRTLPLDQRDLATEIPAPQLVIAAAAKDSSISSWVQYPTAYSGAFVGASGRRAPTELASLRMTSIKLVEDHLDGFAKGRAASLAAIERRVDPLDVGAAVHKRISELPTAISSRVRAAAGSILRGDDAEAVVQSVITRLFVEERDSAGRLVDIEVP
ncbi:MAG: hypothetical protein ACYC96_01890 [Fimbriimonadaceae bacterium]